MHANIPNDRLFTKEHEWVKIEGDLAIIGISDHAQHSLGDVVYIELPKIGSLIEAGKAIGVVESVKAVSDIYAPITGVITAFNDDVIERPELINQDPYEMGWLLKVTITKDNRENLLDAHNYKHLLEREAK